jgi:hypothetical protein
MTERIQLRRTRGWRKPAGAIVVSRPSRWGNPFPVAEYGLEKSRRLFQAYLTSHPALVDQGRRHLAGHDLACWCPLDAEWCHADEWLRITGGNAA